MTFWMFSYTVEEKLVIFWNEFQNCIWKYTERGQSQEVWGLKANNATVGTDLTEQFWDIEKQCEMPFPIESTRIQWRPTAAGFIEERRYYLEWPEIQTF